MASDKSINTAMNKTPTEINQDITNNETRKHILNVNKYIHFLIGLLLERANNHDNTKMESPELELFTELTPKLAATTYNSKEYKEFLEQLKPALDHHYANHKNRHHPEHFPNGINGMNLIDLLEMFVDWKSATLRHADGNLLKSIEINAKRFNIDSQLEKILRNTAELFDTDPN